MFVDYTSSDSSAKYRAVTKEEVKTQLSHLSVFGYITNDTEDNIHIVFASTSEDHRRFIKFINTYKFLEPTKKYFIYDGYYNRGLVADIATPFISDEELHRLLGNL